MGFELLQLDANLPLKNNELIKEVGMRDLDPLISGEGKDFLVGYIDLNIHGYKLPFEFDTPIMVNLGVLRKDCIKSLCDVWWIQSDNPSIVGFGSSYHDAWRDFVSFYVYYKESIISQGEMNEL